MDTIRRYSMFIGGDWVDADERFAIRSPATEELVASVAKGGREHADRAIAAAKAAHADGRWRKMPPAERAAVLDAIADRLGERVGELAVLEALENGAPVRQAGAFQIGFSIAHLRYFAGQARSYAFERSGPPMRVPTLAAGVWSTHNQRALDVAGQVEAGTVWVNDWHLVNAAYPFGGYKQSGLGRALGPHALDEYTEEKFIHIDLSGRLDRRAYPLLLGTPPA